MKCLALVVGINEYDNNPHLRNAEADAIAIADKLEYLKFKVRRLIGLKADYDSFVKEYDAILSSVSSEKPDVVLLYFAGHGMMTNASDCLVLKDAEAMHNNGGLSAKRKSIVIADFCNELRAAGNQITIVIADACRNCMDGMRGGMILKDFGHNTSAPYQTFLAYSTSPGASAGDGTDGHSKYTELLLSEMVKEFQPIESTFKNVRKNMYPDKGNQLSWENTCLVDNFCFNHGQLSPYYEAKYDKTCYVSNGFNTDNPVFQELVEELESQEEDIVRHFVAVKRKLSTDELFVLGRKTTSLYDQKPDYYSKFLTRSCLKLFQTENEENHFLNGLLYEIYFDEYDRLRIDRYPSMKFFDSIYLIMKQFKDFTHSVSFLGKEIAKRNFSNIPYIIGQSNKVSIDIEIEDTYITDENNNSIYSISCIGLKSEDIKAKLYDTEETMVDISMFKQILKETLRIPYNEMKLNWSRKVGDNDKIWLFEMLDFEEQLSYKLRAETWSDIDCLSSLSYVEDISNITVSSANRNEDAIIVEGNCITDVHLEMDHEPMGNIDLPCSFEAILKCQNGIWNIDILKEPHFDTSKYYN